MRGGCVPYSYSFSRTACKRAAELQLNWCYATTFSYLDRYLVMGPSMNNSQSPSTNVHKIATTIKIYLKSHS